MARLNALFAALASLAVAPVQAASFSSASLSDFTITLFDLNPADGITSGITFAEPYFGDSASVSAQSGGDFRSSSVTGTGPFDLSVSTALSSASAAVAGTGPDNVTSLTASGSALGTLSPGGSSSYSSNASAPSSSSFTVTANTLVSFSAFANVEATTTSGSQGGLPSLRLPRRSCPPQDPGQAAAASSSAATTVASYICCSGGSATTADLMTVSFANLTGSDMEGQVSRSGVRQRFQSFRRA